jgi:hypothetical protein
MFSKAAAWRDGREVWAVIHDAEEGLRHLEVKGEPPKELVGIRERVAREQKKEGEDCDCFIQIPMALAAEITGYDHENQEDVELDTFVKPTWFGKIFGRG